MRILISNRENLCSLKLLGNFDELSTVCRKLAMNMKSKLGGIQ